MRLDAPYKILDLEPLPETLAFDFSTMWTDTRDLWYVEHESDKEQICVFDVAHLPKETKNLFRTGRYTETTRQREAMNAFDVIRQELEYKNVNHPAAVLAKKEAQRLSELYGAGVKSVHFVCLPPGTVISRHIDATVFHTWCHRVHLPVVTDPNVCFEIDGEDNYFPRGKFFEFDNKRMHSVQNYSDNIRIHLVVDLLPNMDEVI